MPFLNFSQLYANSMGQGWGPQFWDTEEAQKWDPLSDPELEPSSDPEPGPPGRRIPFTL